jgi:hypothetical protein
MYFNYNIERQQAPANLLVLVLIFARGHYKPLQDSKSLVSQPLKTG